MMDYYLVLGVPPAATSEEIKKAYREQVKKWHPDVCRRADAHERMIELTEAYELLMNPVTRREYDLSRTRSYNTDDTYSADYKQARRAARSKGVEYSNVSLDQLLMSVLALGIMAVAATVEVAAQVGKVALYGEEGVRKGLSFGNKVSIGFKGIFLIIAIILSFTLIAAPVFVPVGIMIAKSLTYQGKFIGLSTLIESVFIAVLILIPILVALLLMINQAIAATGS